MKKEKSTKKTKHSLKSKLYCTVWFKIDTISLSVEHQDTPLARKQGTAAQPLSSRFWMAV